MDMAHRRPPTSEGWREEGGREGGKWREKKRKECEKRREKNVRPELHRVKASGFMGLRVDGWELAGPCGAEVAGAEQADRASRTARSRPQTRLRRSRHAAA